MRRPRVRDASAVQGMYLTMGFAVAAFFPFLALYLRDDHGLDESQIGVVLALTAASSMVANPIWGHLSDTRIGRLTALQVGLAGSAVAAFMLNAATAVPAITLLMVAQAFFMDAQEPNVDAIALEHLGEGRMSDYGRIRGWSSLTYASGCLLFGAVLQRFGIGWAMPLYATSTLFVLAWSTTVIRDHPHVLERHGRMGSVGAVFRHAPRFWGFLVAAVLVWTGFNAAWNFIGPRIEDQGGGPFLIGLGTALGGVMEVPVMRSSSRLQRRFGLRKVYMAGCIVYGLTFLLWGSVSDPTILSVTGHVNELESAQASCSPREWWSWAGSCRARSTRRGTPSDRWCRSGSDRSSGPGSGGSCTNTWEPGRSTSAPACSRSARRSSLGSRSRRPPSASPTWGTDMAPTCRFAEDPWPLPRWAAHVGKRGTDG